MAQIKSVRQGASLCTHVALLCAGAQLGPRTSPGVAHALPAPLHAAHALPEVRRWALRSVQFKLQNGLLAPAALVQDADLLGGLLGWFERDADEASCAVALEVLSALAQHPGVAAQLLALGADQVMLRLQPHLPPYLGALADQLLTDLCISGRGAGHDGAAGCDELPACYSVPQLEGCLQPAAAVQLESLAGWSPLRLASPGQELSAAPSQPARTAPDMPGSAFGHSSSSSWAVQQGASRDSQAAASTQQRMEALARYGRSVNAAHLSPEDQQQLSDLVAQLQLERPEDEATAQQALLQLHAGALADIPVAGILAAPGVVAALLSLVNSGAPAAVRLAALDCLHGVVSSMAAAVSAAEEPAGAAETAEATPIGPVAHQLLQACARALGDARLHHVAVALLADLLQLTASAGPLSTEEAAAAFCYSWRSALAAIADALHLAMVCRHGRLCMQHNACRAGSCMHHIYRTLSGGHLLAEVCATNAPVCVPRRWQPARTPTSCLHRTGRTAASASWLTSG